MLKATVWIDENMLATVDDEGAPVVAQPCEEAESLGTIEELLHLDLYCVALERIGSRELPME